MVITQPTIDDFSDTTVMRVIRKIVNYICSDSGLVAQINNNDITGFTSSYKDNVLKIDATKGDGTTIPVCNLTIQGGSSTGNPYPTGIKGTVGADGNITFTVTMSTGSPLTTTINMNYFASADDLSDLQKKVTGLKLTSSSNKMSINGTSANIINSIGGQVAGGNLKINVNGIESANILLPSGRATIELLNNTPSNEIDNVTLRSWIQAYPNSILFIGGYVSAQHSGYMKLAIYTKPLASDPENKNTGGTYYQCWGENWISSSDSNQTITRLKDTGSVIFGLRPNSNGGTQLATPQGSGFRITLN